MNNDILKNLLEDICMEELLNKKNTLYSIAEIIIISILFLSWAYKNGVLFVLIFIMVAFFLIKHILKKKKARIEELNYSKSILLNDNELKKEIENGVMNTQRMYMVTENFYIDFKRKNIVKFSEIDKIKIRFSYTFTPFIASINNYGLSQFFLIITKDNKKISISNWSGSNRYPEDGEIYNILLKKTSKNND